MLRKNVLSAQGRLKEEETAKSSWAKRVQKVRDKKRNEKSDKVQINFQNPIYVTSRIVESF